MSKTKEMVAELDVWSLPDFANIVRSSKGADLTANRPLLTQFALVRRGRGATLYKMPFDTDEESAIEFLRGRQATIYLWVGRVQTINDDGFVDCLVLYADDGEAPARIYSWRIRGLGIDESPYPFDTSLLPKGIRTVMFRARYGDSLAEA